MKLNYKRTFFIGLAFLSICAFWQLYDNIIPLILKNTFELGESVTGIIMALDNVLALFLLPLLGGLSDKVNTRLGRRTPFIICGTAVAVVFIVLLPFADRQKNFVFFVVALGLVLLAMCSYRSPAVALMPDLTPKPLRSKANAVINLMGALGGVFTLAMIMLVVPKTAEGELPDYRMLFICVAALMVVAVVVLVLTIRERKLSEQIMAMEEAEEPEETSKTNTGKLSKPVLKSLIFILLSVFLWFTSYNAVTTAFSRYAEEVWNLKDGGFADCLMIATVAAVISYIPIGIIASKIGRKLCIMGGVMLMTLAFLAGCFFDTYSPLINVVFVVTGFAWAAINVNSYPMVVEMSKGSNVGKYTGYYYTFSMAAQIFTPIFSGILLENVSYRTLFPYAVFFSFASFITMIFVKHGDSKPQKKQSVIENFDVDD